MKFFIRQLTPDDEPFLWEMLYQAIYIPEGRAPLPREVLTEPEIAKYVFDWGRAGDLGFAAVDETSEQPVGAVWIRFLTGDNRGYGYVDDLTPELSVAMLPGYRNRGVGTALLNHLFAEARVQHSGLSLSVSIDNPARRLYERLGFKTIERNATSLTMLRRLPREEVGVED